MGPGGSGVQRRKLQASEGERGARGRSAAPALSYGLSPGFGRQLRKTSRICRFCQRSVFL